MMPPFLRQPSMTDHTELLAPVPVKSLPDRLSVSKSRTFALLGELAIARISDGGVTAISGEDFLLLEAALAHCKSGGTMADFKASRGLSALAVTEAPPQSSQSGGTPLDALLMAVAALVERQPAPVLPPAAAEAEAELSLLQKRLDILKTLADGQMALSTSDMAAVLDIAPASLRSRAPEFIDYGLRFTKESGQGRAVFWRVSRLV